MTTKNATEIYTVEVTKDPDTNTVIREEWRNGDGLVDRLNDLPAITEYDPTTGSVIKQFWRKNGQIHRDGDKPAYLEFDTFTGNKTVEAFWMHNRRHRGEGQPANQQWSPTGMLLRRAFIQAGLTHKTDGPAVEYFDDETGDLVREEYFLRGQRVEPF